MKMASVDTMHNPQSRYINCAARFQRNVRRQLLSKTTADVRQLVCMWIFRELHPLDAVCENCFMVLQECIQTGHSVRGFGHKNICISCGSSILRAHQTHAVHVGTAEKNISFTLDTVTPGGMLEQVCMAISKRQQDEIRDMEIQPLDVEHSSNIPQPPPMPMAVTPAIHRGVPTITV